LDVTEIGQAGNRGFDSPTGLLAGCKSCRPRRCAAAIRLQFVPNWQRLTQKIPFAAGDSSAQPCIIAWDIAHSPLIFVRRDVTYCNAVARVTVALLGRFLPRLGPLAHASGPFFAWSVFMRSVGRPAVAVGGFIRRPRRGRDASRPAESRPAGRPRSPDRATAG
jgi:hypothetical protein